MQIKCPECGFDREINDNQIPPGASFATCPKCRTRFRFRADPEPVDPDAAQAAPDDSAARPGQGDDDPKEGDIWTSMDKMRRKWDEIGREEGDPQRTGAEEDDERRREEADHAYRQAAMQGGKVPFLSTVGSVPWEYRGGFLNPLVFLRTVILMVTRLPQFFSGINPYSSIVPAWFFLLVVRGVQMGVAVAHTRLINTLPDGTQQILSMHEVFNIPVLIFMSVCMITLMHFLGAFIVNYGVQMHSRELANFRLTFKVMAYANMPIMLSVIPGAGSLLGLLASLALLLFGIRYAYGFSWRKTVVSVLPYLILSVLFLLMLLQAVSGGGA